MKHINQNQLGYTGRFGEDAAVRYLSDKGYEIIARNAICDGNEIDIIAQDIRYIIFVEVKTRTVYHGLSRFGSASSAVDRNKQQRIISASKSYLKEYPHRRIPRYDVIEVYVEQCERTIKIDNINHIPKAFGSGR